MINNATSGIAHQTMTQNDIQLPGLNLGSGQQFQNLDNKEPMKMEGAGDVFGTGKDLKDKYKPEEEKTQGDYENNLYKWENELENLEEIYQSIEKEMGYKYGSNDIVKYLTEEQKNQYTTIRKGMSDPTPTNGKNWDDLMKLAKENMLKDMNKLRNDINNVKNDKGYDNRTDEQKREDELRQEQRDREDEQTGTQHDREDTAYKRAEEDMRKAGLNPMMMFGGGGAAGSSLGATGSGNTDGGGKSKREKEKEKREQRLREQRERERERERIMNQMMMMMAMGSIRKL